MPASRVCLAGSRYMVFYSWRAPADRRRRGTVALQGPRSTTPPDGRVISIGNTRACKIAGFKPADLKQDGCRIDYNKGNLFLQGGSRKGILNGVYALLEEDLGCRWYPIDTTVIPVRTDLKLTVAPRVSVSPFDAMRFINYIDVSSDNNWHGFEDMEESYAMLDPIKLTFTTPGIDDHGQGEHECSTRCQ